MDKKIKVLVLGGTGATGSLLVKQLLTQGVSVKAIVRNTTKLTSLQNKYSNFELIEGSILEVSNDKFKNYLSDCDAVVSCLGHNLTLKGMFGSPRRLVTESVIKVITTLKEDSRDQPIKFVLMNTAGNRMGVESISFLQKLLLSLIRFLLPPHADNEQAAKVLTKASKLDHSQIEAVIVRPDTLINKESVTDYNVFPSPIRSAIFDPGKTSRINVAHFMARLLLDDELWSTWKSKAPVVYNEG